MAMRETARSLRAYFVLVGVLSLGSAVSTFQSAESTGLEGIRALLGAVFGAGFLVAGIRLPRMLEGSTWFVKALLLANVTLQLALAAVLLLAGASPATLVFPALYVAVSLYLIANVNRLGRERRSGPPPGASTPAPPPAAKSRLLPLGLLLLLLGPVAAKLLSSQALSADAAGAPHLFWLLTDFARFATLAGLGCILLGWVRTRRWKRQAQPA
jgi:hypothetical protein